MAADSTLGVATGDSHVGLNVALVDVDISDTLATSFPKTINFVSNKTTAYSTQRAL